MDLQVFQLPACARAFFTKRPANYQKRLAAQRCSPQSVSGTTHTQPLLNLPATSQGAAKSQSWPQTPHTMLLCGRQLPPAAAQPRWHSTQRRASGGAPRAGGRRRAAPAQATTNAVVPRVEHQTPGDFVPGGQYNLKYLYDGGCSICASPLSSRRPPRNGSQPRAFGRHSRTTPPAGFQPARRRRSHAGLARAWRLPRPEPRRGFSVGGRQPAPRVARPLPSPLPLCRPVFGVHAQVSSGQREDIF
jgi:hypothetical protein